MFKSIPQTTVFYSFFFYIFVFNSDFNENITNRILSEKNLKKNSSTAATLKDNHDFFFYQATFDSVNAIFLIISLS